MKKIALILFVFFTLTSSTKALELNLSSENVVLYNLNDNSIIYENDKDEDTSIASLTKIMTTLVAIEKIDDLDKTVTVTSSMLKGLKEANAAVVGLKVGQKVTYNDLLYGTFLASGADATRALTMSLAGTEDNFVSLMNAKAKELGLQKTVFTNTTGLDTKGQNSTVDEVAHLLLKALENEKFKEIFYAKSYTFSNKSLTVYSTLIKTAEAYKLNVESFLGGKTGYTTNAGRCLASIAYDKENDITYLLVTTNAGIYNGEHVKDAVKVYNHYFTNYKYHHLVETNDLILTLPTKYAKVEKVEFYAEKDVDAYLENTFDKESVIMTYSGLNELKSGMKKGELVGHIEVSYNDISYDKIELRLKEDIEFSILEFARVHIIPITISFVLLLLLYIGIICLKKKKKKRRKK